MGSNLRNQMDILGLPLCIAGIALGWALGGSALGEPAVHVDVYEDAPRRLSEYHLFTGTGPPLVPNEGVVPYDLNTPLFSDYTAKDRFVWMPEGKAAEYHDTEAFSFPVGTALIKTFSSLHDIRDPSQGRRILETRLLIHKPSGWVGLPYVWNEEQTEAFLKVGGGDVDVSWVHYDGRVRTNNYILPNSNQCKSCHKQDDVFLPIGPKARNLNKIFPYADGPENQLVRWAKTGHLRGAPDPEKAPRVPVWDDESTGSLDRRARAWLDVNCMHCHNPQGAANTTGIDLTYMQSDPVKLGVMKPPAAAGRGSGPHFYDIVPGDPDASILIYRLASIDPGVMMPELPRRLVDEEGLSLVRAWIASLKPRVERGP